jgi:hypothetical protein
MKPCNIGIDFSAEQPATGIVSRYSDQVAAGHISKVLGLHMREPFSTHGEQSLDTSAVIRIRDRMGIFANGLLDNGVLYHDEVGGVVSLLRAASHDLAQAEPYSDRNLAAQELPPHTICSLANVLDGYAETAAQFDY